MALISVAMQTLAQKPHQYCVSRWSTRECPKSLKPDSAPYIPGIQTSRHRRIRRPLDNRPAIGEERHLKRLFPEFQHEVVIANAAVRLQPLTHHPEINWAIMLMDLHRVPPAQRNVRPPLARQMRKLPLCARTALVAM